MNLDKISNIINDHNNKYITIYLFAESNNENRDIGKIILDKTKFNNLITFLKNYPSKYNKYISFIFRNYECHLYNSDRFIDKKTCIDVIHDDVLIGIYDYQKDLDHDVFPLLNKYNNESDKEEYTYDMGRTTLELIKEIAKNNDTNYYASVSFNNETDKKEEIIKDLKKINNILLEFNNKFSQQHKQYSK